MKTANGIANLRDILNDMASNQFLARINHPQTNGKLERWFCEYQKHRLAFSSFEEFKEWYNNRSHEDQDEGRAFLIKQRGLGSE
jgi:putative transposase